MPAAKPYGGRSVDRLATLINAKNATNFQLGTDFRFNGFEVAADGIYNTRVNVTPLVPGFREQWIRYIRLPISVLGRRPSGSLDLVPITSLPVNIHALLPTINECLGLDLQPSEVENVEFDEPRDTYPLTIRAGQSVAWLPSTYEFAVDLQMALRYTGDGGYRVVGANDYRTTQ